MWQRFTERARRVILLGQEEAGQMTSASVGTEHLLLGLVRENEGVAAQVLTKMGVSLDKVRQEIEAEVQPGGEISSAGEPKLTPKAKRVLELAADEARRMRHNYIGTEHLLLALLREKDGVAAMVLRKLGLNLEKARNQVMAYLGPESVVGKGKHVISPQSELSSQELEQAKHGLGTHMVVRTHSEFNVSPATQHLLRKAWVEAQQHNYNEINVAHLLLALLQTEEWGTLLAGSDADLETVLQGDLETVLRKAWVATQQHSHKTLATGHILLAILQTEEWKTMLQESGLDVETARARLEGHLKADAAS